MKAKATVNYQNVLRVIGQGLEILDVKSFDLEASDDHYVVRGECKKSMTTDTPKSSRKTSFLTIVFNVTKQRTAQTAGSLPFHFTGLSFSQTDIELLDQKGKALQTKFESSAADPHKLSQVLRTVGAYLDQDGHRLAKISWRDGYLKVWHINRQGVESKDILSPTALYDQWVHQYKQRKPIRLLKRTGND